MARFPKGVVETVRIKIRDGPLLFYSASVVAEYFLEFERKDP